MVDQRAVETWRDIILYGANTATYKFALGRSLLDVAGSGTASVSLEELAVPFSRHLVQHVREVPRQSQTPGNRYVALCHHFIAGSINETELHSATLQLGFRYVLEAFPRVPGDRAGGSVEFYRVQSGRRGRRLDLSDSLLQLAASPAANDLHEETETRWSLVERTWQARFEDSSQLTVAYERPSDSLIPLLLGKRRPFRFGVRPALNGYQRGACFYCYQHISVLSEGDQGSDVDHVLPFSSVARGVHLDVDGVWNLVLACRDCNSRKYSHAPHQRYVEQLITRNEWLIASNHPLRETVEAGTGSTLRSRASFIRAAYSAVKDAAPKTWQTEAVAPCSFPGISP